jgi:(E)-4-hydroxy-3-methyl-but-2-enyl pyrophosphate reductase
MEIIIADKCGLCYGVKRALQIAQDTRKSHEGMVVTLGHLIHNPQVIADLEAQKVFSIESPDEGTASTVIIRSHGVSPDIYEKLRSRNIQIVDATCPIVKKIQQQVDTLSAAGEEIIIVGNRTHPESEGLIGYSRGRGIIIENAEQAANLPVKKRRAVLAQSTQDLDCLRAVVSALLERTEELQVFNTICDSTQTRQKSTCELAKQVDTLFIIGGKKSSNTNKLYNLSKKIQPNTFFIENADQITLEMLNNSKKIGLSGGASTPPEAIQEAAVRIQTCFVYQNHQEKNVQCQS